MWAAVLIGFVLVECGVLAANRGRCPLTGTAARHTGQRLANFDIYLPVWLARLALSALGESAAPGTAHTQRRVAGVSTQDLHEVGRVREAGASPDLRRCHTIEEW